MLCIKIVQLIKPLVLLILEFYYFHFVKIIKLYNKISVIRLFYSKILIVYLFINILYIVTKGRLAE